MKTNELPNIFVVRVMYLKNMMTIKFKRKLIYWMSLLSFQFINWMHPLLN